MAGNSTAKECCLCGDVGFSGDLRLCPNCGFRLQHIYCSSSYPIIDMEKWVCEWCLHDREKKQETNNRRRAAFDFLVEIARSLPDAGKDPSCGSVGKKICRRKEMEDRRSNPKRHKSNAGDRWRKPPTCNSSPSPRSGIGRRYKLLADVLC